MPERLRPTSVNSAGSDARGVVAGGAGGVEARPSRPGRLVQRDTTDRRPACAQPANTAAVRRRLDSTRLTQTATDDRQRTDFSQRRHQRTCYRQSLDTQLSLHGQTTLTSYYQQARQFLKSLLRPDSRLHCLLPAPRDKDLISRLRVPRKFPALVSRTKKISHS